MNVYFSGIGGVGIGPLAEIASDAGYYVAGSDTVKSPVTYQLENKGVEISNQQDGVFLEKIHSEHKLDWFIHTAALTNDHPELVRARELGIKIGKRDELISDIIKKNNLKLIAIAGTHGKTTTTGMFVWVMKQLGIPVSYSVGSTLSFGPSGRFDANAQYFVYECDEFDRNFLHFTPHLSLITSVDYDHPDTYSTPADYYSAFQQFIDNSNHTIMWNQEEAHGLTVNGKGWVLQDGDLVPVHLIGEHNRQNATLVIKACEYLGLGTFDQIPAIVDTFPGTARRFEQLDTNLYSDYGHHPTEIAATLQLAKELSNHITLVYQPHQNTRQHQVISDYVKCMELADKVYWLPTYLTREDTNLPVLTPQQLTAKLTNLSSVEYKDMNEDLWDSIQSERARGQLVLVMGAGTIDGWLRDQIKANSK